MAEVEQTIRDVIAPEDLQILISNIGVLYETGLDPVSFDRGVGPKGRANGREGDLTRCECACDSYASARKPLIHDGTRIRSGKAIILPGIQDSA